MLVQGKQKSRPLKRQEKVHFLKYLLKPKEVMLDSWFCSFKFKANGHNGRRNKDGMIRQ